MRENAPKIIVIPAKPEAASQQAVHRQLRVAAYCRVSTDDEEQLTSYEAQRTYYTDKIMTNQDWTMAGNSECYEMASILFRCYITDIVIDAIVSVAVSAFLCLYCRNSQPFPNF